jgi:tetratricopeptide (TPR) repeat protein/transglutaminase-like putative cysteine protease
MLVKIPLVVVTLVLGFALGQSSPGPSSPPTPNPAPSNLATSSPVQSNSGQGSSAQTAPTQAPPPQTAPPKTVTVQIVPAAPDSSKPDYSKEAFVIERLATKVTEEDDGTGVREVSADVKILAEAGVKAFAVLSFTYTSANEAVEFDYVRVRKPDGTVVKTPDYNIQDMPGEVTRTAPLYSDIHEKHVAVKGLGVGDVLEYLVRYRVAKAEVPGQFWFEYYFNNLSAVRDERLEISVPGAKYVKVVSPEFKPAVTEEGTRRVYRWTHTNLQVKEKDPDEIPRRIPPNPDVQMTTFTSWEDVGRWYGGLQKDPLTVTPAIQAKSAELTKGLKTDEEKIHALYNFVSLKFHYIGLDFGIGRYQPHAADDVLDNGYGDCKDKHTLLASLLKAAGYDAWPALINASRKLDPDVPSPAQFNHVITVVPLGGKYIWLDTTPEVAPYGLLLQQLRDKQALVIPTELAAAGGAAAGATSSGVTSENRAPRLMTTPQNPLQPMRQEFSMEGKLDSDGTFTGHADQSYEGDVEVMLRASFRQLPESQWRDMVQRFSRALNFGGDVSNVKITPPDEIDKPFEISYDYVRRNYGDWENRRTTAPLPPMGLEVFKDAKDRKPPEPLLLGALGKVSYRARMKLPAGYEVVPPAPVHLTEPYVEYDDHIKVENGVLTAARELVIKKNEVPLDDWEGYRKFGIALSDDEFNFMTLVGGTTVTLRKREAGKDSGADADKAADPADSADVDRMFRDGYTAMQRNDLGRAQQLYEQVIARAPKYQTAHLDLGTVLAMERKIPEAMVEWHKEQDLYPSDARSYQVPAAVLMYQHRYDEATEELHKLLKVDPKNQNGALSLGSLFLQIGKYPDAVEVLETAEKTAPDNSALQLQLGQAYLKTGQSEKAVAQLRAAVEGGSHSHDPMVLNDVAYALAESKTNLELARQYGEESTKELERRSINDTAATDTGTRVTSQLAMVWDTVGWVYFQNGDLSRAESFVRAAWLLGQYPVVGEHLGEIYEKEGKNKEAAHLYELALAAQLMVPMQVAGITTTQSGSQGAAPKDPSQQLTEEITSRYQKLTGKKPELNTTWRLPNGEWTKTASEQLSEMRTAKFGKQPKLSGSAEFTIVFSPGRVESVDYVNGEEALQDLTDQLKAAHFQVEFPAGSQGKILRRAELSCSSISGCVAVLLPVSLAAVQMPGQ